MLSGLRMTTPPLAIAHVDAEAGFSGGEVQVFLLMEGLRARGHRNVLCAPPRSGSAREAERRGFELVSVPMRGAADLAAVVRLRGALRRTRVDLVHLHTSRATWLGGLAARLAGVRAITTRRQEKRLAPSPRARFVYESLVRRVVAISPTVERNLLEGGVPRARLVRIASSVAAAELVPLRPREETRRALGLAPDDVVVLTLAALVARKGLDLLLAAVAAQDARCVLLVAGDGPERAALVARAQALGLGPRARFLGARDDKAELLAACDVFALPSRAEGLGVAALEAMAAGRAVLATRVGGLGEAVRDDETGLLVPPEDVPALTAALARLVREPALRARLGAAGPARVADGFAAEEMVRAYEQLYRAVLAEEVA